VGIFVVSNVVKESNLMLWWPQKPPFTFDFTSEMKDPPTKILSLFPNPLLLEPDAIYFPTLRELRFGLD
jgi:hypothetical protein